MPEPSAESLVAEIITHGSRCTVDELCLACNVKSEWVATLVEESIIEPAGETPSDWTFSSVAVVRVARAKRLECDLGLNAPGIALALDLLDEIDQLRASLNALQARQQND
jgi:chaperone modulatory protein CbpM